MTQSTGGGMGDAAARLTQDTADLIRAELQVARDEVMATVRRTGTAAALLGGAGVCGVLVLATGTVTVLRGLEKIMPPGRAALVLTTLYAAGAAGLAAAGMQAARAANESAEQALDTASRGVRSATPPSV